MGKWDLRTKTFVHAIFSRLTYQHVVVTFRVQQHSTLEPFRCVSSI